MNQNHVNESQGMISILERLAQLEKDNALLKAKVEKEDLHEEKYEINSSQIDELIPSDEDLLKKLKKYFGFSRFKPLQKDAIKESMKGNDVLICSATASGKSLCYQLPSLISKKTAVIVSPLISLMHDQTIKLNQLGINACYLAHNKDNSDAMDLILQGRYPLIYMSPERINSSMEFLNQLNNQVGICLFAVDEAHCISDWGLEFRPEYRSLNCLRENFPNIPLMAATATGTKQIQNDIEKSLGFKKNSKRFNSSFNRKNLFYQVKQKTTLENDALAFVTGYQSTIIYCTTIAETETIAALLKRRKISVAPYTGKMNGQDREEVHNRFMRDEIQCVVATIAFGMGIDKPDIRKIIHYGAPRSLEQYYQESGRCGRDGVENSQCIIYTTPQDFSKAHFTMLNSPTKYGNEKLAEMKNYTQDKSTCRKVLICKIFEEDLEPCKTSCDNCSSSKIELNLSHETHLILNAISQTNQRIGLVSIISVLRGSMAKKLTDQNFHKISVHGKGKYLSKDSWVELVQILKNENFIQDEQVTEFQSKISSKFFVSTTYPYLTFVETKLKGWRIYYLTEKGKNILSYSIEKVPEIKFKLDLNSFLMKEKLFLKVNSGVVKSIGGVQFQKFSDNNDIYDKNVSDLFTVLVNVRKNEAHKKSIPPYMIFTEKSIANMAKYRPTKISSFEKIDGLSFQQISEYSNVLSKVILKFSKSRDLHTDSFTDTKKTEENYLNIEKQQNNNNIFLKNETPKTQTRVAKKFLKNSIQPFETPISKNFNKGKEKIKQNKQPIITIQENDEDIFSAYQDLFSDNEEEEEEEYQNEKYLNKKNNKIVEIDLTDNEECIDSNNNYFHKPKEICKKNNSSSSDFSNHTPSLRRNQENLSQQIELFSPSPLEISPIKTKKKSSPKKTENLFLNKTPKKISPLTENKKFDDNNLGKNMSNLEKNIYYLFQNLGKSFEEICKVHNINIEKICFSLAKAISLNQYVDLRRIFTQQQMNLAQNIYFVLNKDLSNWDGLIPEYGIPSNSTIESTNDILDLEENFDKELPISNFLTKGHIELAKNCNFNFFHSLNSNKFYEEIKQNPKIVNDNNTKKRKLPDKWENNSNLKNNQTSNQWQSTKRRKLDNEIDLTAKNKTNGNQDNLPFLQKVLSKKISVSAIELTNYFHKIRNEKKYKTEKISFS